MVHREAVAAAERLVQRLVESIKSPPHSPPLRETIVMVRVVSRIQLYMYIGPLMHSMYFVCMSVHVYMNVHTTIAFI